MNAWPMRCAVKFTKNMACTIQVGELLDVVDHILPSEGQHWVSPSFLCRVVSGTPLIREPEKCSGIGWFAPDEMPKDLTIISRENLASYLEKLEKTHGRV